jgi:hypothetical protein
MNIYSDINEDLLIGVDASNDTVIVQLLQEAYGYEFELSDSKPKFDTDISFDQDTVVITSNLVDEDLITLFIENGVNIYIFAL